jgi:hypothetical protein
MKGEEKIVRKDKNCTSFFICMDENCKWSCWLVMEQWSLCWISCLKYSGTHKFEYWTSWLYSIYTKKTGASVSRECILHFLNELNQVRTGLFSHRTIFTSSLTPDSERGGGGDGGTAESCEELKMNDTSFPLTSPTTRNRWCMCALCTSTKPAFILYFYCIIAMNSTILGS